jgi:cell division septation protein DedD
MTLSRHITQLLFDHDCVIVPGFGGFVANASASFHHPVKHLFYPPYKKIAFNRNLQNNDGLLAHAVASSQNIPFADAMKIISAESDAWQAELRSSKRLALEKIGTFYYDVKGNLQFDQDMNANYLAGSFGLAPVQQRPIKREQPVQPVLEIKRKDRPPIKLSTAQRTLRISAVAAAVLLLAVSVWVSLQPGILGNLQHEYSSLNPFSHDSNIQTSAPQAPEESATPQTGESASPLPETIAEDPAPPAIENTAAYADTTSVKNIQAPPAVLPEAANFLIVGGCFRIHENAEKLVASLHEKGFSSASITGRTSGGLHMVSFGGFATREEAEVQLGKIKSEHEPKAWLYFQD